MSELLSKLEEVSTGLAAESYANFMRVKVAISAHCMPIMSSHHLYRVIDRIVEFDKSNNSNISSCIVYDLSNLTTCIIELIAKLIDNGKLTSSFSKEVAGSIGSFNSNLQLALNQFDEGKRF